MAEHLRAARRRLTLALLLQLWDQQVQLPDQGVDQMAAPGGFHLKCDHCDHCDSPHWILDEFERI